MSVGSILEGGIRLMRTQPRVVAIWAVLYLIAMTLGMTLMRPFMVSMMGLQQQIAANAAAGIKTPPVFPAAAFGNLFLLELVFAVLVVIAFAAVVRAIARPTGDSFAYLRIGMDELRLVGLMMVLVVLFVIAEIIAIIVLGAVIGLSALLLGRLGAGLLTGILGIALFCAAIYAQVRISLAGAYTVMRGRIVIRDAWHATRGHFWTLFGAYLVMMLFYLVFAIITVSFTSPHLLSAYGRFNPQAMQAAMQEQYANQTAGFTASFVLQMLLGAVIAVPMGIVMFGGIATAALELGAAPDATALEFA